MLSTHRLTHRVVLTARRSKSRIRPSKVIRNFSSREPQAPPSSGGSTIMPALVGFLTGVGTLAAYNWYIESKNNSKLKDSAITGPIDPVEASKPGTASSIPKPDPSVSPTKPIEDPSTMAPAATDAEGVGAKLFREFEIMAEIKEAKEMADAAKHDGQARVDGYGKAVEVRGKKLPPSNMGEAIELIQLLEGLNRGLLMQLSEDRSGYAYQEKIFRYLLPVFIKEADRMIDGLRVEYEKKKTSELKQIENEFAKRVVIELEKQKHSLFSEYQVRAKSLEKKYNDSLYQIQKSLKKEFDTKVDSIRERSIKQAAQRLEDLNKLNERSSDLGKLLEFAIQTQKRGKQVWEVSLCLMDAQEAMEAGKPFGSHWSKLLDVSKDDSVIQAAIMSVPPSLPTGGVWTRERLANRFYSKVESAVREAALVERAIQAKGDKGNLSIWGYILARITSWVLMPHRVLVEGSNPEYVVSRAGYYIANGQIETAVDELESLSGEPAEICKDWISDAQNRLLMEQTVRIIKTRMAHIDISTIKKSQ
mmetsp:Transcript_7161/g.11109  ORF Transcript_7161/g.11109 Transcript_7161/m.11109 type:complete len:533 (-) Transcript_7161:196-1794(-)